jgi:hypothetical protein
MPRVFKSDSPLPSAEIFDGRLQRLGVYERICARTTVDHRSLTDGRNSIWIDVGQDGFVSKLAVWGTNDPGKVFSAISGEFGIKIAPEDEHKDDERKAAWEEKLLTSISSRVLIEPNFLMADVIETKFFGDVLFGVYLMIGLELVRGNATLMQPDRKKELLIRIEGAFQKIRDAFDEDASYEAESYSLERRNRRAKAAEEDKQEGPADNAFLFEINGRGTIVAVEVERPAINVTQPIGAEVDDLPF